MRRHHEELTAAPALVPALTALIPFGIAIWVRVKDWRRNSARVDDKPPESDGEYG